MTPWCGLMLALVAAVAAARGATTPPGRLFVAPAERFQDGAEAPLGLPAGVAPNLTPPRRWNVPRAPQPPVLRAADGAADPYRLPTVVVPTIYTLALSVDMEKLSFAGSVAISLNVLADTNTVVLHAASNLQFADDSVTVVQAASAAPEDAVAVTKVVRSVEYQTVTLTLDKALQRGRHYTLSFTAFQSELNKSLRGFYVSTYKADGETRFLALTQFESVSAREALPCFDEPAFKARFAIEITHDKAFSARSNMPLSSQRDVDDKTVTTTFATSVPMSTYLVAWVVSDFEKLSNADESFNTWARKDIAQGGTWSQEVGPKALAELAAYTGIPYALTKTDQFAIPDFEAGAMENWGLCTYREELLILTEATDVRYEQEIATVICHELGHQWTGNLVTLDWWSDTWLNEGFATLFENFICDRLYPDMRLMDKAVTTYASVAMNNDLIEGQIAMSSPVSSPREIDSKFDRISYSKGGTVLRMFQQVLTPAVFQKGLSRYLAANMFKTGSPASLFRAFNAEVEAANNARPTVSLPDGVDFATVAKTWTEQPGVPVVRVTCDFQVKQCSLTQQQLHLPSSKAGTNKWYIPVTVATSRTPVAAKTVAWLTPGDTAPVTVDIDVGEEADDWVLINPEQTGYYRVAYDAATHARISAAVKDAKNAEAIGAATRAQLLSDALGLANTGDLDWSETVKALDAAKDQDSSAVWLAAYQVISTLSNELANTDVFPSFKMLLNALTEDAFDKVGLKGKPDDDHNTRHLRYYVGPYACDTGNAQCLAEAKQMVSDLLTAGTPLPVDVATAALCYGIRASDAAVFNQVKDELWAASVDDENMRTQVAFALTCTSDQGLVSGLLAEILAKKATSQNQADLLTVLQELITQTSTHRRFVVDYFRNNLKTIGTFFGDSSSKTSLVTRFLVEFIHSIRSESEYEEVKEWASSTLSGQNDYSLIQDALRRADRRLDAWFRKHYASVSAYIYQATGTTAPPTTAPRSTTSMPGPKTSTSGPGPNPPAPASSTPKPNGAAALATASAASMLALAVAVLALAPRP